MQSKFILGVKSLIGIAVAMFFLLYPLCQSLSIYVGESVSNGGYVLFDSRIMVVVFMALKCIPYYWERNFTMMSYDMGVWGKNF